MTTLTDFLRARLDEDEWEAERALSTLTNEINHARLLNLTSTREEILAAPHLGAPIRRMFAEVEAKRRIIGVWVAQWSTPSDGFPSRPLGGQGGEVYYEVLWHLATVYSNHPDFREEWRP